MSVTVGTALITGGAKRLGKAIALDLAAQGWDIALHYFSSAEAAKTTASMIKAVGREAVTVKADLTDERQVQAVLPAASAAMGGAVFTLLVNSASIFEADTLQNATQESWYRHMQANLRAPFVLSQHFAQQAPRADRSSSQVRAQAAIINMLDQRVWKLTPKFTSYTLTKSALWTLTQTAAQALAPDIRVNGIGPGPSMINERQSEAHFNAQRANVMLERGAGPDEICNGVRYILGADSMTGQMLALDGGQHLSWRTPDIIGE